MSVTDPTEPHQLPDVDAIQDVIGTLPDIVKESKLGYKTTEFWLTLCTSVLVLLDGIPLPEKWEGIVAGALVALYALSRGIAKSGNPVVEPAVPEA